MAVVLRPTQQPADDLDYKFNFTAWLADKADGIVSYTITAAVYDQGDFAGTPAALTIHGQSRNLGIITFFASGGSPGVKYEVTCTVTTGNTPPRVKQDEMIFTIKEF